MNARYDTFSTPAGEFSVAVDDDGAVIATAFGGLAVLKRRFTAKNLTHAPAAVRGVRDQILAYFRGEQRSFDLRWAAAGTAFQQRVWAALASIPFGETRTYGELARALGRPTAARAVGRANATNPICLIVPCHRVIGANGSLTGFAFGEAIKQRLLELERPRLAAQVESCR